MKLGSLNLPSRVLLSPLEGVSDVGFRHLCAHLGAGATFTEMCRAQRIASNNKATLDLIDTHSLIHQPPSPTGIQMLATSPKQLSKALENLEYLATTTRPEYKNIQIIDLNFGCPAPNIINNGAGPALLHRRYIFFH